MPKSRKRKKHPLKKAHLPGGVAFSQFSIGEQNHEVFKEAMLNAARQSVAEFPDQVETLLKVLRERTPNGVLATFGFYGTRATIDDDGATHPFAKDVLQHHIELLQALILTLPFEDWGSGPSSGDAMQVIFDTAPVIADTFVKMRIAEHEDEPDPQRRAILSLQEKIRLHTQAVRNWGYYGEVIRITRELYAPLDGPLSDKIGFSASDLIDIAEKLVAVVEDRSGEHINALRRVLRGKTVDDLARLYYQHMPGLDGNAQDLIDIVPAGTSREGLIGWLLSHSDLRHFDMMAFSAAEVAALTNKPVEVAGKVLDALSLSPGALAGTEVRHMFLANPVWARPGLKLGDSYLFAIPQAIFSHINEIMRSIAADAKLEETLANRRASYLEGKMVGTLQAALPSARVTPNAKWTLGDQQFETDAIVVVDRALIIAEAKSSRVTPQALRGAPDRLKRHLAELVIDPSVQSERLADLIASARNGDAPAQAVMTSLNINAGSIDNVIRISVTLDDLSILSSSEEELSDAGLIPNGHSLAPSLHIADLMCIAEIIDNELFFIHYFAERFHFQKQFDLFGDELDFLGLYLATGFNLGPKRDDFKRIMISGMSGPMDRFYDGRDAGLKVPKPKVELRRVYRDIVGRLLQRKPKGWSTIGIHLLNSASPEEQKEVERGLIRLRKSVSRKSKPPNHECFMSIVPALDRKATIGFFMYLEAEKGDRRAKMEQLGIEALEREEAQTCVIFGKNADRWPEPYEVVLFVQAEEAA